MYKISIIYAVLLSVVFSKPVFSQTIEVELPTHYALPYILTLEEGTKKDTVARGRLDMEGKASFVLPEKYSSYRGIGRLRIEYADAEPIGIVLNNENKIIIRNDSVFSPENDFLRDAIAGQRTSNDKSLYAGRIYDILSCLSAPQPSERQRQFIQNELDFKDLYTSGFWQLMLEFWYQTFSTDDTILLESSRKLLDKTEDIPIRRELTNSIIRLFSKYGKDMLLMELGSEYLTIPINGKPAPDLVTDGVPLKLGKSLILFYDSDCGLCHNELHELIKAYPLLSNDHNQMKVITVSADTDKATFEYTNSKLPWGDKLCDFKGFEGQNFENYGIVGTPTFILVDDEGIVRGRYVRLSEFLK